MNRDEEELFKPLDGRKPKVSYIDAPNLWWLQKKGQWIERGKEQAKGLAYGWTMAVLGDAAAVIEGLPTLVDETSKAELIIDWATSFRCSRACHGSVFRSQDHVTGSTRLGRRDLSLQHSNALVVKGKLGRVQQTPDDVFVNRGVLGFGSDQGDEAFQFPVGGFATQDADEEFFEELGGIGAGFDHVVEIVLEVDPRIDQ